MSFTVTVDGLKEIKDALNELPKATAKNIARRILKERAKLVADAAIARVPVFQGALKKSIAVSTKLTRRQRARFRKDGPNDIDVFAGPSAYPYAHMQEFGTYKDRAQPYMRPAWDATKSATLDGIASDLWTEIEKAVARRAKKAARNNKRGL